MVVTSMNLGGVMVSILTWNAIGVGSIPTLDTILHIFITPHNTGCRDHDPVKSCAVWLLNLPCVCKCKCTDCMCVIIIIKRLTIPK